MKIRTKIGVAAVALLLWTGLAMADVPGSIRGEVTKISGDMVTIKTTEGKMQSFHVDPKTTKKEGQVNVGAMVSADVNNSGHATSVKVIQGKGMEKHKG